MPLSTTKLIERWQNVRQAEAKQTALPPSRYLRDLVVESLSHTEQVVYHYLERKGEASTADVAARFSLSLKHALNVLSHLYGYGVLERRLNPDNARLEYLWSLDEPSGTEAQ